MVVWAPTSGSIGLGFSLLTYSGELRLGVAADAHLVPVEVAVPAARMVNDGIATYVAGKPDRFVALGSVPLRDGLKFHDGQPVRSADCIASIDRWAKRDAPGQKLAEATEAWTAVDDKTFRLKLKAPFPLTLEALAKPSSNVPFIMPERVAKTDAFKNIEDPTGSGPFKMVKAEWVPGNKVVYVKNTDYVPRKEPPSWGAGGKVVKVDRVEWIYIPDSATAAAAINAGEVDWWQQLPPDLIPVLAKNKDIKIDNTDPLGSIGILRFNHLHPPFNNVKMRQAVNAVINSEEAMAAGFGNKDFWRLDPSINAPETAWYSKAGGEAYNKVDLAKAKSLLQDAGAKVPDPSRPDLPAPQLHHRKLESVPPCPSRRLTANGPS